MTCVRPSGRLTVASSFAPAGVVPWATTSGVHSDRQTFVVQMNLPCVSALSVSPRVASFYIRSSSKGLELVTGCYEVKPPKGLRGNPDRADDS